MTENPSSDYEQAVSVQIDQRTRELEARATRDSPEKPPYYQYQVERAPRTFRAVTRRAVALADGDQDWHEGIESELANFTLKINPDHVEEALRETEIYRRDEMKLALKIEKDLTTRHLSYTTFSNLPAYVDGGDIYVRKLAAALTAQAESDEEKASILLSFVQSLDHHDEDNERVNFFQPPSFTLAYGGGACDDLTILYASLLEAANIDYRIIIAHTGDPDEKHALVGVAGDFKGFYKEQSAALGVRMPNVQGTKFDGQFFSYAEPAQANAIIGQRMDGHRNWHILEEEPYTVGEIREEFEREVRQ